ncbi:NAD-P-binding protein [Roridomyces roridus]|uniref:NAD-P-binding protein n=1 Tax=Roridomyces roridus TaxID=1738132 RepID=A0AAD7FYN9_9AGAR|nr:NAD-P-binding protein [Roridomyces roridus]
MPPLAQVLKSNAAFTPKSSKPVALFLGGTSGIGRAMATRFAHYTKGEAHIVVVGRNQQAAQATISSFPSKTSSEFVECDATLMKNVGATTSSLLSRLPRLNLLVLSPGFFSVFAGREETSEGIDKKLALLYYARWRFVHDLMPLLRNAADASEEAKVYSVLGAGTGCKIDLEDLGLKKLYGAVKAAMTAATYTDLAMEKFSADNPSVQFTHAFPGLVRTPMMLPRHWLLKPFAPLVTMASYPFTVSPEVRVRLNSHSSSSSFVGLRRIPTLGIVRLEARFHAQGCKGRRYWL